MNVQRNEHMEFCTKCELLNIHRIYHENITWHIMLGLIRKARIEMFFMVLRYQECMNSDFKCLSLTSVSKNLCLRDSAHE